MTSVAARVSASSGRWAAVRPSGKSLLPAGRLFSLIAAMQRSHMSQDEMSGQRLAASFGKALQFPEGPQVPIGAVGRRFGLTQRALRHYEEQGLLLPTRQGKLRLYGPKDLEKAAFISFCKRAGLKLKEIKELIDLSSFSGENGGYVRLARGRLAHHLERLRKEHAAMAGLIAELNVTVSQLDRMAAAEPSKSRRRRSEGVQ